MVFKRKEKETPFRVKTYKFRIYPEHQKPDFNEEEKQAIFDEARLMNAYWNKLVEIRIGILEDLDKAFNDAQSELEKDSEEEMTFARLKRFSPNFAPQVAALWASFEFRLKTLAESDEIKSSLGWETRDDVFRRFETAHKKALKSGGTLHSKSEKFIEQFHLPHRFTEGGRDFAAFTTGKSKKLYLEEIDREYYENNSYRRRKSRLGNGRFGFGVGDVKRLSFRALIHRRIPEGAKVKTAILIGKSRNRRWEYYLVLTVDEPCARPPVKSGGFPVAGLDLGWRKMDDYLRIGCVVDSSGNAYELRLPISPAPNARYRRMQKLKARHGETMSYPQTWQDIEEAQARNSGAKDRVKERLRELALPDNAEIKSLTARWERVGKRGLLKLQRILRGGGIGRTEATEQQALALLDAWIDETGRREGEMDYARQRLLNQRRYYYSEIADWLKKHYLEIAVEGDLSLRDIAVKGAKAKLSEENGAAQKNSAKYRFIASLSELKSALERQRLPGEEWLIKRRSAYSTVTCYLCGAECERTIELEIVCRQGHKNDQDVQAALNLRNTLADDFPPHQNQIDIPVNLQRLIVPLAKNL